MKGGKDSNDLPIFVKWHEFLSWLFLTTEKFPKKVRFTLAERLNNIGLDMVEDLVEARYSREKWHQLKISNLRLEKMRVLLRICFEQKFISQSNYKHAMYALNEVGSMLGGWLRHQSGNR